MLSLQLSERCAASPEPRGAAREHARDVALHLLTKRLGLFQICRLLATAVAAVTAECLSGWVRIRIT